jgi:putative Mg2+ transporter-C (MgtC) family protein
MAMSDLVQIGLKIGLAALLGGAIGAEREWTGKWAGLRTHMLIAVGAALLTDVSIGIGPRFHGASAAWDPGRIAAQIVSGVGFLGAGTIIQARGTVHGLTTAAGLWVASALGIAVGAEYYAEATVATGILMLILIALRPVEKRVFRGDHRQVVLELEPERGLRDLSKVLEEVGLRVTQIKLSGADGGLSALVRFRGTEEDRQRLLAVAAARGVSGGIREERPEDEQEEG